MDATNGAAYDHRRKLKQRDEFFAFGLPKLVEILANLQKPFDTVEARRWRDNVGVFVGSRVRDRALFAFPLNVFFEWEDDAINVFFLGPQRHIDAFKSKANSLNEAFRDRAGIDIRGCSQRDPITQPMWLDDFGI